MDFKTHSPRHDRKATCASRADEVFSPLRTAKEAEKDQTDSELQKILDGIIDEEYLSEICGTEDLSDVQRVQLRINTSYQSIIDIHNLLPSLQILILDQSTILSVRDLGVGLRHISSLSLNDCGLSDIDGIGVLTGLRELRLRDNLISDVTPLAMHENIEVRTQLFLFVFLPLA
jgi:hypothetical protein